MPYRIFCLLLFTIVPLYPLRSQSLPEWVVSWVEQGNLWLWDSSTGQSLQLASGEVLQPYLSPDGAHTAFTRGTADLAHSLWVVSNTPNASPINLTENLPPLQDDQRLIAQVAWQDNQTLLINTAVLNPLGLVRQDDLWQLSLASPQPRLIFPAGQGGDFTLNPDRTAFVLISPGTYDAQPGTITLVTLPEFQRIEISTFPAVSTASNYRFYPPIHWTHTASDSNASLPTGGFWVALPDSDLIYAASHEPHVHLHFVKWDGTVAEWLQDALPPVEASLFGLPRWSASSDHVAYLRPVGALESNQFELVLASLESNMLIESVYTTGQAGELGVPTWLPAQSWLIYEQGEPGTHWLAAFGQPPRKLPTAVFAPAFVDDDIYVYASAASTSFELRYAPLSAGQSQPIAVVQNPVPVFAVQAKRAP